MNMNPVNVHIINARLDYDRSRFDPRALRNGIRAAVLAAIVAAAGVALGGCSQQQLKTFCAYDQAGVPVAQEVGGLASGAVPALGTAVAIDQSLVHPLVVAECQKVSAGQGSVFLAAPKP